MIAGFLAWLARLISGATALWLDCKPSTRQRIYFANHTSHMDFVVLWSVLPSEVRELTRPVAAKEYWTSDKVRHYIVEKVFRAILVERQATDLVGRQQQIQHMVNGLGKVNSLIFFPEGTRGTGEEISAFKSGLYHIARQRPDVELVPVYLENLNRVMPKGEYLPVPLLSKVFFGAPIQLENNESKDAFLERARAAVVNLGGI
jgi:1-acyl-sn-glycerol-3-phosphate acyltransferase